MRARAIIALVVVSLSASGYLLLRRPNSEWDPSADSTVVQTSPGLMHIDFSYVPDVKIWGNGDMVWVEHKPDGSRQVFWAQLSDEQLLSILQQSIDAGLFSLFGPAGGAKEACSYPGVDNELVIQLRTTRATESIRGSGKKICEFAGFLAAGAGVGGVPYRPERGFLYLIPLDDLDRPIEVRPQAVWSVDAISFDLDAAILEKGQFEIRGDALQSAWELVNQNPVAVVTIDAQDYLLGVQIPELWQ